MCVGFSERAAQTHTAGDQIPIPYNRKKELY